jgi:hypothetical protein
MERRYRLQSKYHPILPIEYTIQGQNIQIDESDKGIFEVKLLGNKIFPPRKSVESELEKAGDKVESAEQFNKIEDIKIKEFFERFFLSAQRYDQEMKDLQWKSKQFLKEMDFMANYFAQAWGVTLREGQTPEETLEYVRQQKNAGIDLEANETKGLSVEVLKLLNANSICKYLYSICIYFISIFSI